jgi:hypothetical protein
MLLTSQDLGLEFDENRTGHLTDTARIPEHRPAILSTCRRISGEKGFYRRINVGREGRRRRRLGAGGVPS